MALSPQRRYQDELKRYGLGLGGIQSPSKLTFDAPVTGGSVQRKLRGGIGSSGAMRTPFAEDGAGPAAYDFEREEFPDDPLAGLTREEAIDYLVSMDIDVENPTLGMSEIVKRAKNRPESILPTPSSDVGSITEFAEAYAKLAETNRPEPSIPDRPDMSSLMKSNPSAFADSPLDAIAAQIAKAQIDPSLSGANDSEIAQRMIGDRKRSAEEAAALGVDAVIDKKMNKDAIAGLLGDSGSADKDVAVEDAFLGGMSEYYKALAQEVPEVGDRKELLKKYMQEFSEATGIPVGEKVDKSQALMALGLSLMQNRAGSGFNVGKILSSVGQAGEAAMPYLTKAKDEAKQARIAAGKYALQQIESDENASTAVKTANIALYQDLALENIKHENEMKQKILEAELEGNEPKLVEALKSVGDLKVRIGSQDLILKRGANLEDQGRVVWQDPVADSKTIATAYRKTTGGLNSITRMNELLNLMSSEAEGKLGATAAQGLLDKAKEVGKAIGMDLGPYTGGEDVSPRVQYEKLSNALLANFKRYLTSETGNGISTYDVKQIEKALGKFGTFDDIAGAKMALEEIMPMFTDSLKALGPIVNDFSDRNQYRKGVAGDEQYNDVMKFLSTEFGQTNLINPVQITRDDGTIVTEYDVSY
ncbi:hypothetical protein OAA57_00875 [bacterium]|nr:hypothetical protein [bacterium]